MSGTTKQSSKRNKLGNKRTRPSPEEQYRLESVDRYEKLSHACSKHLHREAKVVKSFECQKIVRAIKTAKDAVSVNHPSAENAENDDDEKNDEDNDKEKNKSAKRIETLQLKLERTKKMDLDVLVQVGLKRLGVVSLDPRVTPTHDAEHNNTIDENKDDKKSQKTLSPQQLDDPFFQTLLESMFRHKRLSTALDQLNVKVIEYRQWTTRWETMQRGEVNDLEEHPHGGGNKKKNKKMNQNDTIVVATSGGFNSRKRGGLDMGGHEGSSGLFIGSLAGHLDAGDGDADDMAGNEEDDDEYGTSKKKNRPGQRARKAKATAIEARKAGKTWDSSMNWREKKKGDNSGGLDSGKKDYNNSRGGGGTEQNKRNASDRGGSSSVVGVPKAAPQHIASMGKTWKDEGNAHPSWVAAAAQKSQGIAKFEGKKITFD